MGEGDDAIDEDKIIVRSNGTVTYTGKDIAYQLWKLGKLDRDFRYRLHRTDDDGHRLWTTTSGEGEAGAPAFGHAEAVYNVIDVGQSYPQRVVKAGVAALGHAEAAEGSHHLAYEKVVLSPATARALGYDVSEDEAAVKVSGRKGLGVKADDLVDALVAKAQGRGRRARPGARRRLARGDGHGGRHGRAALLPAEVRAHPDHHVRHGGGPRLHRRDGALRPERRRARPEHLRQARGGGPRGGRPPGPRALGSTSSAFLSGEEGDEVWSLLLLMARSEEVAEQAIRAEDVALVAKHAFAVAQAFHSYYQKPKYSVLYAETEDLRACPDPRRGRLRAPDGGPAGPPRHPGPGADVTRPVIGITLGDGDEPGLHAMREDYVRSVEQAGGLPLVLPPVRPEDVPALLDRLDGVLLSGGVDVDPALYGQAPHPKLGQGRTGGATTSSSRSPREALRRDLPILAICRGHQVLNVATGGTLVQDIPSIS